MLKLILGSPGTGKSETIYRRICDSIKKAHGDDLADRQKVFLIVPEQISFESERNLLQRLGPRMATRVNIWSFTKMVEEVFREVGGIAGRRIDDPTRALLVSKALNETTDLLKTYKKSAIYPETVTVMIRLINEFKTSGISLDILEGTLEDVSESNLKSKLEDVALIFGAYEALLEQSGNKEKGKVRYLDPLDDLTVLSSKILESKQFDNSLVFIDSFKGFTGQEFEIIEQIIKKADVVTVSLPSDSIVDPYNGFGLFAPVVETGEKLRELARKNNIPIAKIEYLTENRRAKNEALKFVEKQMFRLESESSKEKTDNVILVPCTDIYEECDFVARKIRNMVREDKRLRYRDIAVVVRNLENYRGILDSAFEKQEVSYSLDSRTDIRTEPLISLVISSLDSVCSGYRTEDLLKLIKTGLAGFSINSTSILENYVYMWQINGLDWVSEFAGNPEGLEVPQDEKAVNKAEKKLWYINILRRRLINPIVKLKNKFNFDEGKSVSKISGEVFAKGIYDYLISMKTDKLVRLWSENLKEAGETKAAERMETIWNTLMVMLDRFATVFSASRSTPKQFSDMFNIMSEITDIGQVPQSLDAVQIGAADRIRFSSPRTVFIVGANEGVFPAYPESGGLFSDKERRELIALELPLANTLDSMALEERFIAYQTATAPFENLIISYYKSDRDGGGAEPSSLVDSIENILPNCKKEKLNRYDIESKKDFLETSAMTWTKETSQAKAFREVYKESETNRKFGLINSTWLDRISKGITFGFENRDIAKKLFKDDMTLSPSKIELYHKCKFAYFCRYGLKAKTIRKAELDHLAFGTLAHYVMEKGLPIYYDEGLEDIDRKRVEKDVKKLIHNYVKEYMGGLKDKTNKFIALMNKLIRVVTALLWQVVLELSQSDFMPVDFELSISDYGDIKPVSLTLPDGSQVKVVGTIDRVDVYKEEGQSYIRIIDYKTGIKTFNLSDVVQGINMQMLIYLSTLWENGKERYGEVVPAGMLYLNAALPVLAVSDREKSDSLDDEKLKLLKMNGLLLDDVEIINKMQTKTNGVFIPASITKDGNIHKSWSSVATLEQFGVLKEKAEKLIIDMAETLKLGDVSAVPVAEKIKPCSWCEFRAICGIDSDDPVRYIKSIDKNKIFEFDED